MQSLPYLDDLNFMLKVKTKLGTYVKVQIVLFRLNVAHHHGATI